MSNILGENHLPYVQNQIRTRQTILGKPIKDPQDQVWMNARDSWVRLVSSVDIANQNIYQLQQTGSNAEDQSLVLVSDSGSEFRNNYLNLTGYSGNQLAKELVLHGGISNNDDLRFGITQQSTNLPSNMANYGFGNTEFGPNPMPGITGFNSKTYNNGSLREAEISILAHNKEQFEYIESIYLRLGYTMLLEWGNSIFPKDENTYASKGDISSLTLKGPFLNGSGDNTYYYTRIEELREESNGNYDAFLATVKNFSWNYTTSGTYEITLKLISQGSVAESLKIALPSETVTTPSSEDNVEEQDENALITTIETLSSPEPLNPNPEEDSISVPWFEGFSLWGLLSSDVSNINYKPVRKLNGKAVSCCAIFGSSKFVKYIRFKTLLDGINKNLLIYVDKDTPLIKIDTSEDLYGYSNTYSISSDPSKMIVKFSKNILGQEVNIFSGKTTINGDEVDLNIEKFHDKVNNVEVCNIMNLYFSSDYLIEEINNTTDKENNLSLYKFIENLLSTANNLLGNVNKFRLRLTDKTTVVDETLQLTEVNQVLEIYDEVQPYGKDALLKNQEQNSKFRIYGVKEGTQGSFVTDYNLVTEISKNLSTMVAIGAQAGGAGVGEDATMFSKWNLGLVDRIIPKKLSQDQLREQASEEKEKAAGPLERLQKLTKLYSSTLLLFSEISSDSSLVEEGDEEEETEDQAFTGYGFPNVYLTTVEGKENFTKFTQIQSNWFQRSLSFDAITKRSVTPTIGFLPIKLSLTFDGLSGIKIFDKLSVDTQFLPANYGETLEFITTELDHYLENNKWYTRVGTQSIPNTYNFTEKEYAKINLEKIFVETVQFDTEVNIDQGIVGETYYRTSALGFEITRTFSSATRAANTLNKRGEFYLPYVGAKNTSQKAGTGKLSPMVSIGKLGQKVKILGSVKSNVTLSSQNSDKQIYIDQYDSNYYLARPAAFMLRRLIDQAKRDGISFTISSAYRNTVHNKSIGGATDSAHAYGGAIDIEELFNALSPKGTKLLAANALVRNNNSLYKWLEENGPKYGWFNPYRFRNNSGINEVWHWEFWGVPGENYALNAFTPDDNGIGDTIFTIPTLEKSPNLSVK